MAFTFMCKGYYVLLNTDNVFPIFYDIPKRFPYVEKNIFFNGESERL